MRAHRQRPARFVDSPLEPALGPGDDREAIAQPLGMTHDMRGKQDRRPAVALGEDQRFEMFLIDRVESRKRFIKDDQFGAMDDGAKELDELRHPLRHFADFGIDHRAEPGSFHQRCRTAPPLAPRQPA